MSEKVPDKYNRKICVVKENKSFRSSTKAKDLVKVIVADLQRGTKGIKEDQGLVCRACSLIENLVSKKDKINKFDLLVDVYKVLFVSMTPVEIEALRRLVQFCLDSKMIKKVSRFVKLFSYCKNVFIHNFLFRE